MHAAPRSPQGAFWLLAVALALAPATLGCAETVRQTAKEATPAAVEGAIKTAQEPENRRDIAQVMSDPKIKQASAELTRAVVGGALDALTSEQRMARLDAFSEAFVQRVSASIARSIGQELRPQIAETVAESTDRALARLLSEQTQQRAAEFTVAISRAAVRGVSEELQAKEPSQAGNPAVSQDKLGHLAQRASQGFALGFQDAVSKSEARDAKGDPRAEVLASVGQAAKAGRGIFSVAGLVAFGGIVMLAAALVWVLVRMRNVRKRSELQQSALQRIFDAHPELRREARV